MQCTHKFYTTTHHSSLRCSMTLGQFIDRFRLRVVTFNNHHNDPQHEMSRDVFCILGQDHTGQDIPSWQNLDRMYFDLNLFANPTCNRGMDQPFCTGITALGLHVCSQQQLFKEGYFIPLICCLVLLSFIWNKISEGQCRKYACYVTIA